MNCPVWMVLPLFQPSPREVGAMVSAAEELDLRGVVATDHLAGWRDPAGPVLEATTVMGMVAAVARCRVGSMVLQSSLRTPAYTARVVETLADLCREKPLIGLGVGDRRWRREAERVGLPTPPLRERLRRLRQTIAAIRSRAPDVEIWVGGWRPELRELAAERADGWNAWGGTVQGFEAAASHVRRINPSLHISWGGLLSADQPVDLLRRALESRVEAGAASLVVALIPPRAETLRGIGPRLFNHPTFRSS